MGADGLPKKAGRAGAGRSGRAAGIEAVWRAFRRGLAEALGALEKEEFLILAAEGSGYFVQFAAEEGGGMRVEAVSNAYITQATPLSEQACRALQALGWRPPTYRPSEVIDHPPQGSPNFYCDFEAPAPCPRVAALAVKSLRAVYGVRQPGELTYKSFSEAGESIRLPMLRIRREAPAPRPAADGEQAGAPPGDRDPVDALMAQGETGPPVPVEVLEARLRARLSQCEEAREDAVWQLARFYSLVRRFPEATACVTGLLAGTDDPEKLTGGTLGLGQLLEQQEHYAEAEAVYARGLAIRPPTGRSGYFLLNNRGYCLNILGRHAEAETSCRAAIALDPARHNAHKNLGLALAGQGRAPEAARELLEADRRFPADERARGHLVELLAEHPALLEQDAALAAACRERGIRPGHAGRS